MKSIRRGLNLRVACVLMVFSVLGGNGVLPVLAQQPEKTESPAKVEKQEEPMMLELGKSIERELNRERSHSYQVSLVIGECLEVSVTQKTVNVGLSLISGQGETIFDFNFTDSEKGIEKFIFVPAKSDKLTVNIFTIEQDADGAYLLIAKVRKASEKDQVQSKAYHLYMKGAIGVIGKTKEELNEVINYYSEAEKLWRNIGEMELVCYMMNEISNTYSLISDVRNEFLFAIKGLEIAQKHNYKDKEGSFLNGLGIFYSNNGDYQKSIEYYLQAIPVLREIRDHRVEAAVLSNIGQVYFTMGENKKALDYYNEAQLLMSRFGFLELEGHTLNNIGFAYFVTGEIKKSLDYYNKALKLARRNNDFRLIAVILNNTGGAYLIIGEYEKAMKYFLDGLNVRVKIGERRGESNSLSNIGRIYSKMKNFSLAEEYFSKAIDIQKEIDDKLGFANNLINICSNYKSEGNNQKALECYQKALSEHRKLKTRFEGQILNEISSIYLEQYNREWSMNYADESLLVSRSIHDRWSEVRSLFLLAQIKQNQGKLQEALIDIENCIKLTEFLRSQVVNQESRTAFFETIRSYYSIYINILLSLDKKQPNIGYREKALQISEQSRARTLIELLTEARADIRQGVEPALLEREKDLQQRISAKSDILIRLKSTQGRETQAEAMKKEIAVLTTELEEIRTEIRQKSPKYAALTQPQPLGLKEIQELLDPDTVLLEYALGDERSYLWAVTKNDLDVYTLPKGQDIDEAARKCYGLLSNRNKLNMAMLDAEYRQASAELSRMVLTPVGDKLNKKRIVVVADGALQYVPFTALPISWKTAGDKRTSGDKYLIEQSEIVNLPSATALAVQRRELKDRKPAEKLVAVVADPIFGKDDPRFAAVKSIEKPSENLGEQRDVPADKTPTPDELQLDADLRDIGLGTSKLKQSAQETELSETAGELRIPRLKFAGEEADNILSLVPATSAKKAVGFEANKTTAFDPELSKYQVVHFATHGFLNADHPELSGLVLSLVDENGNQRDGFLRAMDVFNLNLPAETVVLSACRTGLGKEIKGEGLMGLSRGFMYAGAKRLVVSLWNVNDKGTSELMTRFYRKMLKEKQRPAAALRAAQLELMREKNWSSPFFWAPFVLQGEWR